DDLAATTGCWLFIGAQHPSGAGSTIHYTSPRLLRDAPSRVEDLANDMHQLMTDLLQSRRSDALTLSLQLKKSQVE
ncbi:hypothetical protein GALMADRAFT_30715, partial [Galerina marginata CBS 339.88]